MHIYYVAIEHIQKRVPFYTKKLVQKLLFLYLYFFIYGPISMYALVLKFLWEFADNNIRYILYDLGKQKTAIFHAWIFIFLLKSIYYMTL